MVLIAILAQLPVTVIAVDTSSCCLSFRVVTVTRISLVLILHKASTTRRKPLETVINLLYTSQKPHVNHKTQTIGHRTPGQSYVKAKEIGHVPNPKPQNNIGGAGQHRKPGQTTVTAGGGTPPSFGWWGWGGSDTPGSFFRIYPFPIFDEGKVQIEGTGLNPQMLLLCSAEASSRL